MSQTLTPSGAFDRRSGPDLTDVAATASRLLAEAQAALDHDLLAARACLKQLGGILKAHGFTAQPEARPRLRAVEPTRGGLAPWQMRLVTAHVDANLDQTIHVEVLANLARLSTSHFCRAFKVSFGETPHVFVMGRRLERARKLMLTTSETLCQIAALCGLADQAHLTRLFRRHFDETPYQWRRAWRQQVDFLPQVSAPAFDRDALRLAS